MTTPVELGAARAGDVPAGLPAAMSTLDPAMFPLDPARFAETREGATTFDGQFEGEGQRQAGSTYQVAIGGRGGVPVDAEGVVIYLTAVDPEGWGFITVTNCESGLPVASSVNYSAGITVGNEIVADLSRGGELCVFTYAATDLTIDVVGYLPPGNSIVALRDARVLETREGAPTADGQRAGIGRTAPGSTTTVPIAGRVGVPLGTDTVIVNVAALEPADDGFVVVHPCLATTPGTSSLNYSPGIDRANELITPLNAAGELCIFTQHDLDLIVDVVGYVPPGTNYVSTPSRRYLETRVGATTFDGQNQGEGIRAAGSEYTLPVAGRGAVPDGAIAVIANIAGVDPLTGGFLTVHPCLLSPPVAASLNYQGGSNGANEIVARLDDDGEICIYTFASTHLLVDITGYLMPEVFAATDSYDAIGNVLLEVGDPPSGLPAVKIAGSILDNDIGAGPLTVTDFDSTTSAGGTVDVDTDGTFTYIPPAGVTGITDTFEYTLSDGGATDVGMVMIDLADLVWFVDNTSAAATKDGTSAAPFDALADAGTASGPGSTIFVYEGDGTDAGYDQGITLDANQRLIGEIAGLTVGPHALVPPGGRPDLSASGGADTVALGAGSFVTGFTFSITGSGAALSSSAAGATVEDVIVVANSEGIDLDGATGTFTFADVDITSSGGPSLQVNGGTADVDFVNSTIDQTGNAPAVDVSAHTGTVGFDAVSTITATNGTGLQFDDADGTYDFPGTVTLNGGDAGIDILNDSAGTFTFADTTITDPTGVGVKVQDLAAGGDIDYTGPISSTGGVGLIDIDTTAAGSTVDFHQAGATSLVASNTTSSGIFIGFADGNVTVDVPVTIDNAGFSAIFTGLGAGTLTFRDVVITDQKTGNAGVDIISDNGTVTFTNLDIQADYGGTGFGGLAFLAEPGNVVNVFGADNDISSNGGPAVALSGGTSFDVTFDDVTSTNSTQIGPTGRDGVVIFQAGTGTFTVTGTTTIDNTTEQGIDIDGVSGTITFADVDISNTGDDGISTGAVNGAPATVTINGGTFDAIGNDALEAGLLGIPGSGGNLTVNNVVFTNVTGFIGDFFNSTLGGSGNTAAVFSCSDDGGNSGFISFNAGADSCP